MQRFIFASLAAGAGLFYMNKTVPFTGNLFVGLAQSAEILFFLLQGFIMVVIYKVISGQLSGPGWTRGMMYGIIMFGLSSFMWAGAAGLTQGDVVAAAVGGASDSAVGTFKQIFAWQGAIIWVLTGAIVGSILQDKPAATPTA